MAEHRKGFAADCLTQQREVRCPAIAGVQRTCVGSERF
jgi:hypothetical protein